MIAAPALRLRGVTVRYGSRTALREVDLSVERGEVVALAGPNGSGKTTLIRAVLGLLPLDEGTIEILGDPLSALSIRERARRVAWVPQGEGARDDVRLEDYIQYGRYAHREAWAGPLESDRAVVARALETAGLADRARDGILSLSGGERQRATLARALAQDAPVLLLDEPTSHLDIGHQLDFLGRVRQLARERGVTVVAALHDLNLAARFTDRVVVLSRGRQVADGPAFEVLSEDLLRRVWGVVAERRVEPQTGVPYLIPRRMVEPGQGESPRIGRGPVHVVGGGGSAAPLLRALVDGGFRVTAGVLALLDSDQETAESLGVVAAVEAPFAPVSDPARERMRSLLEAASAVVVAPFPVGPSNLPNLEEVRRVLGRVPVYLLRRPPALPWDFTGGIAASIEETLRRGGAHEVGGVEELLHELRAGVPIPAPP